ncbi:MAG: hypothetical protein MJ137_04130 [Clostridia bacterium]|nr:hypothetical protein [Clostridia bacterium]
MHKSKPKRLRYRGKAGPSFLQPAVPDFSSGVRKSVSKYGKNENLYQINKIFTIFVKKHQNAVPILKKQAGGRNKKDARATIFLSMR